MPVTLTGVKVAVKPTKVACPPTNGKFTVTVTVTGTATTPGTYDVEVWDEGPGKDKLDELAKVTVSGGSQEFSNVHTFKLWCDDICEVVGRLKSSGNQKPKICAHAIDQDGNKTTGNTVSIICGPGTY